MNSSVTWKRTSGPWGYHPEDITPGRIKGGVAEVRLKGGFLLKVWFPTQRQIKAYNKYPSRKWRPNDALIQFAASGPAQLTETELVHVLRYIEEAKKKLTGS